MWPASWNWRSLLRHDGVAEVDVGGRGVDAELDAQLAALALGGGELRLEGALGKDLDGADGKVCDETGVGHGSLLGVGEAGPQGRMIPQAPASAMLL